MMATTLIQLLLISSQIWLTIEAFSQSKNILPQAFLTRRVSGSQTSLNSPRSLVSVCVTPTDDDDSDPKSDDEGVSLAADFFKTLQARNIDIDMDDLLDDDEDDEEDDEGDANEDAKDSIGSVVSDDQVYSELKERVLESAGGFVDLVSGADEGEDEEEKKPKVYQSPKKVPDPALTAGEVVTTVLEALNNNDTPSSNRGIEVLFGYSSAGSAISQAIQVEGMTSGEYADFLKMECEYKVLFNHYEAMIEKGDYSFDKKKAFFTARLIADDGSSDGTNVNFILSTQGQEEDDCWLIDSVLIRPEGMRRRRRR